jgi:hypothetical protein
LLHVRHSATQSAALHEPGRMMHAEPLVDVEVDDELVLLVVVLLVVLVLLVVVVLVLLAVVLLLDAVLLVLLAPPPPLPPAPLLVPGSVLVAPPCPPPPVLLAVPPAPPTGSPPRPSMTLPWAQLAVAAAPRERSKRSKGGRMVHGIVAGSGADGKARAPPRTVE